MKIKCRYCPEKFSKNGKKSRGRHEEKCPVSMFILYHYIISMSTFYFILLSIFYFITLTAVKLLMLRLRDS